ncbi:MAG: sugar kinase [Opitutales bacterium]|nr:sugar kinase [Opitutales bacterium]|tara:strand:+ start:369 stop:1460 length:1092 start_codon:yes stop_codon:yes gene_type:complete
MKTIVTFGEIMGRLCPHGHNRFRQSLPGDLNLTFAGAEANVAASIAMLGGDTRFVTALPDNDITQACLSTLRGLDVDTNDVVLTDQGRLGLYFVEAGANQRPSRVIYDREYSSVSMTPASVYDWESILDGAGWFHTTGITPALSEASAEATIESVKRAKAAGLTVSCDLNFRKKLWAWNPTLSSKELAGETMRRLLPYADLIIGNEEDASDVLGIKAENTDVHSGKIDATKYATVAREIVEQFPNVSRVAITLRESISASHNNWGAMLYDKSSDHPYFAPLGASQYQPYEIRNIVDRVGGGDSFGAGLIFALNTPELKEPQTAIAFAVAASCLAHSIYGDFNFSNRSEVEALLNSGGSGRVVR